MGLEVLAALLANGVSVGAALTAVYGVVGGALISLAGSALVNSLLTSQASTQQAVRQSVSQSKELPYKRHVVGRCFANGTPSPGVVANGHYYVPYLLNSRESEGNFEVYLDGRVVQATGDEYDFSGDGAEAQNGLFDGHVTYWISRGDETGPPDEFVNEAGYDASSPTLEALGYKATDGGQGCTIIWLKLKRGSDGTFQDRWTSYPFVNVSVLGDWSKVWDPRDSDRSATDTATHLFSRNQALIGLDLAMRNPFRPYSERLIDIDMWKAAADVADQSVALKSGGSEPRYQCGGTTLFDGTELEQLMSPIMLAGASSLVRSGGRLGVVPGIAKTVVANITDMVSLPTLSSIAPPERQYDEVQVTYAPLDRDGEQASLTPWNIPGVVGGGLPRVLSVDLAFVESATQAMRLRKIMGLKTVYVRTLEGTAFPDAISAVSGSWLTTDLGYEKLGGTFEVKTLAPMAYPTGDKEGIAYRVPIALQEISEAVYDWDEFADEEDVDIYEYVYDEDGVKTGGPISIETGDTVNVDTGGTVIPRVKYTFEPSDSPNISGYQVQVAEQGESYSETVSLDSEATDGSGDIFGYFSGIAGQAYDLRVRAVSGAGFSDYVEFTGATPVVNIQLDAPILNSVTGGAGVINIDVSSPDDSDVVRIEVIESSTNDETAGNLFFEATATANQRFQFSLTGVGANQTKYIFARVRGDFASASSFASGSATTDI